MSKLKKVKDKMLNSNNSCIRKIGKFIYRVAVKVSNSRIMYYLRCEPWLNDKKYIIKQYKKKFGVKPNLIIPKNFNEKNNWRKLYDRKEIYTLMVDKYKVKEVIREKCGEEYFVPLLGVWNKAKDIDFHVLPNKFVLKANHAGGVIVCRDKSVFDKKTAVKELSEIQKRNYYYMSREWPYKNVKKKIICEQYIGENLTDYKNYCFNGKLQYTFVWENKSREDGRKPAAYFCGAYDREWKKTSIDIDYPSKNEGISKPDKYDEMIKIAEKISKDIPFVRVDCYIVNNRIYIGELTFFPWGGFQKFKDKVWNDYLGDLEVLPIE